MTLSTCGIWVELHSVYSPPTGAQTTARGSIADGISRCCRYVRWSTVGVHAGRYHAIAGPPAAL